jgi:predicted porin
MKRAVFVLGLVAFVVMPVAAQWTGMPVWNSPKGGTGITINGDWGRPDSASGKGNAFGGRASLGLGTLTLTAGIESYKPENATSSVTSIGGNAAMRVIGGSLIPVSVNLQVGAARSDSTSNGPATTSVIGAVGFAISLPTPGVSIEPYVSPGVRYRNVSGLGNSTNFGYTVGANLSFGMFGVHAAYDYEHRSGGGHTGILGLGAHVAIKVPLGM